MTIDFDDDLEEMLDPDDHAQFVIHSGRSIPAIYNDEFFMQQSDGMVEMESTEPTIYMQDRYARDIARNDVVKIEHRDYVMTSPQPDGKGLTRLVLRRA